jgi:hypothetical protein
MRRVLRWELCKRMKPEAKQKQAEAITPYYLCSTLGDMRNGKRHQGTRSEFRLATQAANMKHLTISRLGKLTPVNQALPLAKAAVKGCSVGYKM